VFQNEKGRFSNDIAVPHRSYKGTHLALYIGVKLLKLGLILGAFNFALTGCGDPSSDTSGNQYLAVENYTHLELYRADTNNPTLTYSIDIDLNTGNATGVLAGAPFSCLADDATRNKLFSAIRAVNIQVHNAVACTAIGQLNYEVFYSNNSTTANIDGCNYSYVGNGRALMDDLFNTYKSFCTFGNP
jgi:hypothetical protein